MNAPTTTPRPEGEDAVEAFTERRFHDPDAVRRAVKGLSEARIPDDQIEVYVEEVSGRRVPLPVKERQGALQGALVGALAGAVLAGLAALVATSLLGVPLAPFATGAATGAFLAAASGALAGVVIGGFLGLGRWTPGKALNEMRLREGAAVVVVRGDGLQERARRVLDQARDGAAA